MAEDLGDDAPLSLLFERGQELYAVAESSALDPDQVARAVGLFERCQELIDKLSLFSSNEEKEDISTGDLKFLLVPYYLGFLTEKLSTKDTPSRLRKVDASKSQLLAFIRVCDRLELVPSAETEALAQETAPNAEARRNQKLARFKRQKAAQSQLQEIKERQERRRRSSQAAAKATRVENGDKEAEEDDEEEREARFAQISFELCKALDLLEMLKKEEEMLNAVQEVNSKGGNDAFTRTILDERQARAEGWHKEAAAKARATLVSQPLAAAMFGKNAIEGRTSLGNGHQHAHTPLLFGPASVVDGSLSTERERMVAEVFQPSHRLPTMSIEEAGLAEMNIMREWNEKNQKIFDEANTSWHNDGKKKDDDSDDEAAEYKARDWDDWKDENPRGAGNSALKPVR
ncbi:unnamed protein product [Calypogeia fissa]